MSKHDVAIIGAGPAGLMAAITASGHGKRVVLVDRNAQIGRKLLSTGNGRCNLTNTHLSVDRFHGASPEFIGAVIDQFDQNATMQFFRDLGLILKEEDEGRVFPRTNQASSVVEVLRRRLCANGVEVVLNAQVKAVERPTGWVISLIDDGQFESEELIIATGGRAAHHLGSTGDGLFWARRLGHTLTPIYAALVPVETVETWPAELAGVKIEARVWATSDGRTLGESAGDLLFTSYGVSGPSVMALAGSIAPTLKAPPVVLHIDLFPDMTEEQLDQTLLGILASAGRASISEALVGLLPSGMIEVVLRLSGFERTALVRTLKSLTLTVSKLRPLKEAQVTAGGVRSDEIDPRTLQSKLVQGLYFAGEVIDVDGDSGGFNLQWAWSSGRVAGMLSR
jgi:predicted Rossmann fold flavoprotein